MKVSEIVEEFGLKVVSGHSRLEGDVKGGYVSDLLSDVIGHAPEGHVWVTLQTHQNIVAVASLKDLPAIILVQGVNPNDDTIEASNAEGVPILVSQWPAFKLCGKLYAVLQGR